eukprot:1559176-Pyramimonas_sp.AAC.1
MGPILKVKGHMTEDDVAGDDRLTFHKAGTRPSEVSSAVHPTRSNICTFGLRRGSGFRAAPRVLVGEPTRSRGSPWPEEPIRSSFGALCGSAMAVCEGGVGRWGQEV